MPLYGAGGKFNWREPIKVQIRSECVAVDPPFYDDVAGLRQAGEEMLIEAFVTQPAAEALDEAILDRLARRDVMPFQAVLLLPSPDRV